MNRAAVVAALALSASLAARAAVPAADGEFAWRLPSGFPAPRVPADNPITPAKVALGRHLFYDTRLSGNGTQSCASCHEQARAFTDGRPRAIGSTGEVHPRGSMSLANVGYTSALTWANASMTHLEDQALVPMFGDRPVELGVARPGDELTARLRRVPKYQEMFAAAYGTGDSISIENVTRAIASFERTIISGRSPYDRYHFDRDESAISDAARRGERLFFSSPLSCFRCHSGFTLSGAADFDARRGGGPPEFHNNGTGTGKFKAPTLRNIAVTAPYMHDGSIPTLEAVVEHYARGGTNNPDRSPIVHGFSITAKDKRDLIAFLQTLTDDNLLHDPDLGDPWKQSKQEDR
jgi:cytochrome c peroxidase